MYVPSFLFLSDKWPWPSTIFKTATGMFSPEAVIFNNGHLEMVAPSPKINNPNIFASLLIIYKLLFMFCSWITSISSLDIIFLLGGLYFLETFLASYSIFLNIYFWARLKERPSDIIISSIEIVRQVSLELMNF